MMRIAWRVALRNSALIRDRLRWSKPDSRLRLRKLPIRLVFASVGLRDGRIWIIRVFNSQFGVAVD